MTPEEFTTATAKPLGQIAALHYFGKPAMEAADALGIDGFRFYFVGRAGVLGDTPADVAHASFGYFNPAVMAKMWETGKERANVVETVHAQLNVAYALGEDKLSSIEGLTEAAMAMREMATVVDAAGLALFAGFRALEAPKKPAASFMHQAIVHRELRGSVHLACCAALGIRSRAAHQLARPDDQEMFGYKDTIEISNDERALFEQLEPMTNRAMARHAQAITAEQRAQVAAVVGEAHGALGLAG